MALHMNRNRYAQFFTELKLLTDTSMYSTCVYETTDIMRYQKPCIGITIWFAVAF